MAVSILEPLLKTAYDLLRDGATLNISSQGNNRLAYAIPAGSNYADYAPWNPTRGIVRQIYMEEEPVTTLQVEVKFAVTWEYTQAQQYIENVDLDVTADIPTTYTVDAAIEFTNPRMDESSGLEMAVIPFKVNVNRSHPLYGIRQVVMHGEIRGDGTGYFNPP